MALSLSRDIVSFFLISNALFPNPFLEGLSTPHLGEA